MFGRPKIVKVERMVPVSQPLFDLPDFKTLSKEVRTVYESPDAFYGISEDGILRVKKKTFSPTIRKVKSVAVDFSQNSVYLDEKELFSLAADYGLEILATHTFYVVLSHDLTFLAPKEDPHV